MRKNVMKALAALTAVSILGVSSMFAASAADEALVITDEVGVAGGLVDVEVWVVGNEGLDSGTFVVLWDDGLEFVSASGSGGFLFSLQSANLGAVGFMSDATVNTEDFKLVTFTFLISEDAEVGDVYDVYFRGGVVTELFLDGDLINDDYTLVNGSVEVIEAEGPTEAPTTPPTEETPPQTGVPVSGAAAMLAATAAAASAAFVLRKRTK